MAELTEAQKQTLRRLAEQEGLSQEEMAELGLVEAEADPNWRDSQAPEGMVYNPSTGAMTERALLREHVASTPSLLGQAVGADGITNADAAVAGAARGATFGGVDEMAGAVNAVVPGRGTMGERYAFGREMARAIDEAAAEKSPALHTGGEIVGAGATALGYSLPAMAGKSTAAAVGTGAGIGAGEGALYGALTGEGAQDRRMGALQYGALGAAVGGAAPIATSGLRQGYLAASDVMGGATRRVTGRPSQSRANRAIAQTLTRSGRSIDEADSALATAAREGQPEYRLADALGVSGQRRLSGIARSGEDASQEIAEFLNQRQVNQPERVAGFVEDAFDLRGSSARAARQTLQQGRDEAADIAFDGIRGSADPVDIRPVLSAIDERLKPYQDANVSAPVANALRRLRSQLTGNRGDKTFELSGFDQVFAVRRALADEISSAYQSGKPQLGRQLKAVREAMDDALQAASPEYRQAMEDFARSSRVMDAVETGAEMSRPGQRAIDTTEQFARMSPDEQAAARGGYGDRLLARVESTAGEGSNRARPLTSAKRRTEAEAIAAEPDLFLRRIARENEMFETRNRALMGSRTADNLEDIQDLNPYDASIIANILSGRLGAAGQQAVQAFSNVASGMDPSTRQVIARALLSGNADALRTAIQQADTVQGRKAIVDALLRVAGHQNVSPALIESGSR